MRESVESGVSVVECVWVILGRFLVFCDFKNSLRMTYPLHRKDTGPSVQFWCPYVGAVKVWHPEHRRSYFILTFPQDSDLGYSSRQCIITYYPEKMVFNLNLPSIVAKIIQVALENDWKPQTQSTPCIISDGFLWLLKVGLILGEPWPKMDN
jgi:hypothetical protein